MRTTPTQEATLRQAEEAQARLVALEKQRQQDARLRVARDEQLAELRAGLPEFTADLQHFWRALNLRQAEIESQLSTVRSLQAAVKQADLEDDKACEAVIANYAKRFDQLLTASDPSVDKLPSLWFGEALTACSSAPTSLPGDLTRRAPLIRKIDEMITSAKSSAWPGLAGWRTVTSAAAGVVSLVVVAGLANGCGAGLMAGLLFFGLSMALFYSQVETGRTQLFEMLQSFHQFAVRIRPLSEEVRGRPLDAAPNFVLGSERRDLDGCRKASVEALVQVRRPVDSDLFWEWLRIHFSAEPLMQERSRARAALRAAQNAKDDYRATMVTDAERERFAKVYDTVKIWIAEVGREVVRGIRVPGSTIERRTCPVCAQPAGFGATDCLFCGVVNTLPVSGSSGSTRVQP